MRARLLDAASTVVLQHGLAGLTLDAVARAAGVSKGGLLHHYPSKEALIHGLFAHLLDEFDREVERAIDPAEPPGTPGRYTRAYIRASFATDERQQDLGALLGLLVSANPELLTLAQESFARARAAILADGLDPVRGLLVQMATDGVIFYELLGMQLLPEELCAQLYAELLRLTFPEAPTREWTP
ncbi:MAG: TetR/AcrR family transcriptional regulator [Chloroflexi bacterium OHK40]